MDRLSQLRGGAGGSRNTSLDESAAGDSFLTANDTSSKYFSLSEDVSFDIAKDVSLAGPTSQNPLNDDCLISNLSPIGKKEMLDYKIGKQIEAANILSGGVDIFDDNDNSYDGNELVIDDNVEIEDKSPSLKSPDSSDLPFHKGDDQLGESSLMEDMGGKETEVVLQIDGKNVDAINIGNGLYLYRKEGQEELAAVQIIDDDQHQPSFKFLKVRENAEGNLEVYEEIEIEVPKEAPMKEGKSAIRNASHVPIKDITKVMCDPGSSKVVEKEISIPDKEVAVATPKKQDTESSKDVQVESITELNLNGKMVKISESRKSPLMAYHSTPNKEGIPLTKTMVDQQLHPSRHSDNIKKTIEVHTDSCKQRILDTPTKTRDTTCTEKSPDKGRDVSKPFNKVVSDEKGTEESEVAKESIPDVIENKSTEVISSNVKELNVDEVKKSVMYEPKKTEIDTDLELNTQNKQQEKEDEKAITISDSLGHMPDADESVKISFANNSEPTTSLNENKEVKEIEGTVKEMPIGTNFLDVKVSETVDSIEKVVKPEELVDSEEVDENALIIEEVVDSQPEEPSEIDIKELATSNEVLANANVDQELKEKGKPSVGKKEMDINVTTNSNTGKGETEVDNSKVHIEKSETNKISVTKYECKTKIEGTKTDSTQKIEKDKISEPQIAHTEKISSAQSKKDITEIKTGVLETYVPEIKFENAGNADHKLDKVTSKVEIESFPETSEKKEKNTVNDLKNVKISSVLPSKEQTQFSLPKNTQNIIKLGIVKSDTKPIVVTASETKMEVNHKLESAKQSLVATKPKSINNNHAPVPFGKWTEANRQDFLNKIKESKVPVNSSNANQLKQANDLNRRDVLKKIDSQRQTYNASVKVQESLQKGNVKTETAFASKPVTKHESKVPEKSEAPLIVKPKPILNKKPIQEAAQDIESEPLATVSSTTKQETQRKEINNQDLIDKTIEGIINRAVTGKGPEDVKQTAAEKPAVEKIDNKPVQQPNNQPTLLDAIEIKMNELHGIPFVERPPHELPRPYVADSNTSLKTETEQIVQKVSKIPNLLPLTKSLQKLKDCEDDIMKHEPEQNQSTDPSNITSKAVENLHLEPALKPEAATNLTKKDTIITEKDFDKFVRRNSVTYENSLTVSDGHQVIQTVVPKDIPPKKISRNEQMLAEAKAKSPHKHPAVRQYQPSKGSSKYVPIADAQNKQYQSKLQMAYQTALTAKRHMDSPITIIEDKPVKVVYLESAAEFSAMQLNVQGRDLSPAKRPPDSDAVTVGTCDSLDSDMLDAIEDVKAQDETKTKSKHPRKQVLTPVDTSDLELIEPGDLGIEVSPKKKRKTEDKPEKSLKNLVPKKSYLLGRSVHRAEVGNDLPAKVNPREVTSQPNPVIAPVHNDAVSAIDNLVKAAELLENQSESINANVSVPNVDSPQSTPVKRGRGRPRKNPLPEGSPNAGVAKAPSPQKKPRLIDAKAAERVSSSDDDTSDDDMLIKENWTMGKINEDIVCPICSKLFRSENVVFKHVKHCTGPSPSRSDSDKRSPRRSRLSRESESKSRGSRYEETDADVSPARNTPRKRKSKDSGKSTSSNDDVVAVENNPKESENKEELKKESRKSMKTKLLPRTNLVCEICGKSFRQLSYLVSHKRQHKKDEPKRAINETEANNKPVFSCETCKKDFRKLHHLVQHRLIHNPVPPRVLRKTSSEQMDLPKSEELSKVEDQSAGFRCEPCDKSFRKLHHLVEHRETHDGINRQRSNSVTQVNPEKPTPPPQCDICKKTFRKLHHMIEHKEQHLETSSEKSDDQKSVKSSLSTKDIIHECNLCYMVFPNEHSLNKHTVICIRKKKQSAAKKAAEQEEKSGEDTTNVSNPEESKVETIDEPQPIETDVLEKKAENEPEVLTVPPSKLEVQQIKEDSPKNEITQKANKNDKELNEPTVLTEKKVTLISEDIIPKITSKVSEAPPIVKEVDEIIVIEDTPKKKVPIKERVPSVTKRQKAVAPPPTVEERKPVVSSSDDDDIRYMFNPDFKIDDTVEGKNFMKVRAKKRSSLQIERPNSKDLVRRKSLLQHPPKIPRLRAKSDDTKITLTNPLPKQTIKPKLEKIEQVPSIDSDDSDVKYSFPKTVPEKTAQKKQEAAENGKKRRKTMTDKRKSLSGIAKRKSLGKPIVKPTPAPAKPAKRRAPPAEHRCDCGQLFGSAALLARHASLAHTPPRLRRRREPPAAAPAAASTPAAADKNNKSTEKPKLTPRSGAKITTSARKSSARSDKTDARKSVVPETTKKTRSRVHGGVPLPDKRPRKQ